MLDEGRKVKTTDPEAYAHIQFQKGLTEIHT